MMKRDVPLAKYEEINNFKPMINAIYDHPVQHNVENCKPDEKQFDVPLEAMTERDKIAANKENIEALKRVFRDPYGTGRWVKGPI